MEETGKSVILEKKETDGTAEAGSVTPDNSEGKKIKRRKRMEKRIRRQLKQERIARRAGKMGMEVEEYKAFKKKEREDEVREKLSKLEGAPTALKINNVGMRFNLSSERVEDLKSYVIKMVKGQLHYHEFWALKDVSFEVKKGERVGIVGLNGAGKSTLLKIVAGVLKPTEGSVSTKGRIVPLLELGAGFDKRYTGAENIFLNGAMLGYSKEFLQEKYKEIVEFSELGEFINVPVMNYSSGMKARLGFSIATIVEPEILILDEVLSVGDVRFRMKSERKIREMFDKGVTVLFVSHSLEQVKSLCDTAILLEKGRLVMKDEVGLVAGEYTKRIKSYK